MLVRNNMQCGFWIPECGKEHPARLIAPGNNEVDGSHFRLAERHGMVSMYLAQGKLEASENVDYRAAKPPKDIGTLSVRAAKPWIAACADVELLELWKEQEQAGKARASIMDMLGFRLAELELAASEGGAE